MLASLARGCSAPKSLGRLGEAGSPASERAEASLRSRAAAIVVGAIVGAIPGVILVLLTGPVSGEAELTLGVGGFFIGFIGLVVGASLGARRRPAQPR